MTRVSTRRSFGGFCHSTDHRILLRYVNRSNKALVVQSGQFTDVQPCPNQHANMTPVAGPRAKSRIVINHNWKTCLRSSANSTLTKPRCGVPRANFASNEDSHGRQKTNMPMAAANITRVVSPTDTRPRRELGWFCMIVRSEATSQTPTSRKGASRPLMIAVQ